MSHFTVAVFTEDNGKTVDALLAPYQENNMGDCPKEYLQFVEDEDGDLDKEVGKRGYWANPNTKWDWYQVGGRWSGILKATCGYDGYPSITNLLARITAKPGRYDSAKIKDIDFQPDPETRQRAYRFWEVVVEGSPLAEGEDSRNFFSLYKPEYYIKRYGTKDAYADCESAFTTFAVITPDGQWHGQGEMGWWACSSETPEEALAWETRYRERFLDSANPEWRLTIVDCHI